MEFCHLYFFPTQCQNVCCEKGKKAHPGTRHFAVLFDHTPVYKTAKYEHTHTHTHTHTHPHTQWMVRKLHFRQSKKKTGSDP